MLYLQTEDGAVMAGDAGTYRSGMSFRIYADQEMTKLDKEIVAADQAIREVRVFKDRAINQQLIDQADASGRDGRLPHGLLERLRSEPHLEGKLRGSLLDRSEAKAAAKELAARLEARAEMRLTHDKYDDLHSQASAAERLPHEQEAEQLEGLQNRKAYCDAARDSRQIEFRDAMEALRSERGNPGDQSDPWTR